MIQALLGELAESESREELRGREVEEEEIKARMKLEMGLNALSFIH